MKLSEMSREALEAMCEARRLRADANAEMYKHEKLRADEACKDRNKHFYELLEVKKERDGLLRLLAAASADQPKG